MQVLLRSALVILQGHGRSVGRDEIDSEIAHIGVSDIHADAKIFDQACLRDLYLAVDGCADVRNLHRDVLSHLIDERLLVRRARGAGDGRGRVDLPIPEPWTKPVRVEVARNIDVCLGFDREVLARRLHDHLSDSFSRETRIGRDQETAHPRDGRRGARRSTEPSRVSRT